MIVTMMAITPSLNASRRALPMPRCGTLLRRFGRPARACDVLGLDPIDVHSPRSLRHVCEERLHRRRLPLHETQRVDACNDERAEKRALEAALLQAIDDRADRVVEREQRFGASLALRKRCGERPADPFLALPEHRVVRATGEPRSPLVREAERGQRRLLELECQRVLALVAASR